MDYPSSHSLFSHGSCQVHSLIRIYNITKFVFVCLTLMPATQCKNGLTETESGRQVRKAPGDVGVADTLGLKEGRKEISKQIQQ